jgi:hypothetical protein
MANPAQEVDFVDGAVGRGLLAGLVGAAAIIISQKIEMYFTGREES